MPATPAKRERRWKEVRWKRHGKPVDRVEEAAVPRSTLEHYPHKVAAVVKGDEANLVVHAVVELLSQPFAHIDQKLLVPRLTVQDVHGGEDGPHVLTHA